MITNAEEIAFYDGSRKERNILDRLFNEIYQHSGYVQYLKGLVGGISFNRKFSFQVFDNFLVKYGSSITGYIILAMPIYYPLKGKPPGSVSELTGGFVRNRQLLISLSAAIAQLIVLSNKIVTLAGLTARVSELLEMVRLLDTVGTKPFAIRHEEKLDTELHFVRHKEMQAWLVEWRQKGEKIREMRDAQSPLIRTHKEGGQIIVGKFIRFENVTIVSPDGRVLVEGLSSLSSLIFRFDIRSESESKRDGNGTQWVRKEFIVSHFGRTLAIALWNTCQAS